jgi:hypothetical protein
MEKTTSATDAQKTNKKEHTHTEIDLDGNLTVNLMKLSLMNHF